MMILPRQIRAARALLDWTAEDLAERLGVSKSAVSYIESGKNKPSSNTRALLYKIFVAEGINFTPYGVEIRDNLITTWSGADAYKKCLEDVMARLASTQDPVVYFHCADESALDGDIQEIESRMRNQGILLKKTVSDNTEFFWGPKNDYRLIPADYVEKCRMVTIIYGNYVVLDVEDSLLRILSPKMSKVFYNQFDYWWESGKKI